MTANELRMGNWIYFRTGTPQQFESTISAQDFFKMDEPMIRGKNPLDYFQMSPIPLTEEWLLRFGFRDPDEIGWYHLETDFADYIYKSDYKIFEQAVEPGDLGFVVEIAENIKYVHQLQNIYFFLTGEELTLNK